MGVSSAVTSTPYSFLGSYQAIVASGFFMDLQAIHYNSVMGVENETLLFQAQLRQAQGLTKWGLSIVNVIVLDCLDEFNKSFMITCTSHPFQHAPFDLVWTRLLSCQGAWLCASPLWAPFQTRSFTFLHMGLTEACVISVIPPLFECSFILSQPKVMVQSCTLYSSLQK